MISLSNIPEPTNNAPRIEDGDGAAYPLATTVQPDTTVNGRLAPSHKKTRTEDTEQQVDCYAVLLLLMIAAVLLRLVLGMLGPIQGIELTSIERAAQEGKNILAGNPGNAYPVFDLIAYGFAAIGLPAWCVVLLGSLLTIASIPAAFIIGKALTGRSAAGILAAAITAVHPAVLTAANSYDPTAIALSLTTLGLALIFLVKQKKTAPMIGGGILLGLAGLAAPVCWVVGAVAGPVVYKLTPKDHGLKALGYAALVTALALAPTALFRATLLGTDANALLSEWNTQDAPDHLPGPIDRALVTMSHPSFKELGQAMHLPVGDPGRLKVNFGAAPSAQAERDVVADTLADGWLLLNAGLAGLAAISVGVMLARRRLAEALLLTAPLVALTFSTLPPSESLRLPLIAMVGVLAAGLLATRSAPQVDEAAREAKRLKKLAKREEKEQARQERELQKHRDALAAFDMPKRTKPKQPKPQAVAIQSETIEEPVGARPI